MLRSEALEELGLDEIEVMSMSKADIRKHYYKCALLHHPDKGGSKERFQTIKEAYELLSEETEDTTTTFWSLLQELLKTVITNDNLRQTIFNRMIKLKADVTMEHFSAFLEQVVNAKMHFANFLDKHGHLFQTVKAISVNVSLKDMMLSKIVCVEHQGAMHYVPTWHSELIFGQVAVSVVPVLPPGTRIDRDNNIIVVRDLVLDASSFGKGVKEYDVDGTTFSIPLSSLVIAPTQQYRFLNRGLCTIDEDDVYNVDAGFGDVVFIISVLVN